jgi:hypothetical protein
MKIENPNLSPARDNSINRNIFFYVSPTIEFRYFIFQLMYAQRRVYGKVDGSSAIIAKYLLVI